LTALTVGKQFVFKLIQPKGVFDLEFLTDKCDLEYGCGALCLFKA
jgi:hypothetical protein